jgi:hypothetical protein
MELAMLRSNRYRGNAVNLEGSHSSTRGTTRLLVHSSLEVWL